jgi:hypothetical protein
MAVSCEPSELAELAKCFVCLTPAQKEAIRLYLLAVIAGGSTEPATLLTAAKCFTCLDATQKKAINTYLLCQAANGGAEPVVCADLEGAGSPEGSVTPEFEGQLYRNTDEDTYYRSTGLTESDWTLLTFITTVPPGHEADFGVGVSGDVPGVTEFSWHGNSSVLGFDLKSYYLESIRFPNLTEVTGGFVYILADQLTNFEIPLLESTSSFFYFSSDTMTSLSAPSFITCPTYFEISGCNVLTTISLPNFLPTLNSNVTANNNALNAASVNHILARCIANAGYTNGTVLLDGGTNAAPTGQGITDKNDLIARGCTVTTN